MGLLKTRVLTNSQAVSMSEPRPLTQGPATLYVYRSVKMSSSSSSSQSHSRPDGWRLRAWGRRPTWGTSLCSSTAWSSRWNRGKSACRWGWTIGSRCHNPQEKKTFSVLAAVFLTAPIGLVYFWKLNGMCRLYWYAFLYLASFLALTLDWSIKPILLRCIDVTAV